MSLNANQFIRIRATYHGTVFELVRPQLVLGASRLKVVYTRTVAGKRLLKAENAVRSFIVRETIEQMWAASCR